MEPFPHASIEDSINEDNENEETEEYEVGDKIFAATILSLSQEIYVTRTFSSS
jgi:hypothetical protein